MNLNLMVFIQEKKLPKINEGAYVINLDEFKSIGTYWIALYVNCSNIIYSDSFGVEDIPKKNCKVHKKQKYDNKYL